MLSLLKSSVLLFAASLSLGAWGATSPDANSAAEPFLPPEWALAASHASQSVPLPATLPRMAPELALRTFQ